MSWFPFFDRQFSSLFFHKQVQEGDVLYPILKSPKYRQCLLFNNIMRLISMERRFTSIKLSISIPFPGYIKNHIIRELLWICFLIFVYAQGCYLLDVIDANKEKGKYVNQIKLNNLQAAALVFVTYKKKLKFKTTGKIGRKKEQKLRSTSVQLLDPGSLVLNVFSW